MIDLSFATLVKTFSSYFNIADLRLNNSAGDLEVLDNTGATTVGVTARSVKVAGTNGSGHIDLRHQASSVSATGQTTALYANSSGELAYKNDGNAAVTLAVNELQQISITSSLALAKATHADKLLIISGASNIDLTLDTAVSFASSYHIKVSSAYSGVFRLLTVNSETIDANSSPQRFYAGESFRLTSNNTNWLLWD